MKKKILYSLIAIVVLIQFIRIDTENPLVEKEKDFLYMTSAPAEMVFSNSSGFLVDQTSCR